MDGREILSYCLKKGLLVDKEVLELFSEATDFESAKLIIENLKSQTNQKIITRKVFDDKPKIMQFFSTLPKENQQRLEKLKIKLGLSIEILHEREVIINSPKVELEFKEEKFKRENSLEGVKVVSKSPLSGKKFEVNDFIQHFRSRFSAMREILQDRPELDNLVSINKISGEKKNVSVIGMVSGKKVTKNKNLLIDIEDLTGKITILINQSKKDLYQKADEIALDSVVGFKASGSREILFANEVIFPDAFLLERKKSPYDENVLFLGDLHFGSKRFYEKSFSKFLDYLDGKLPNTPEVEKIKYVFIVGDLITGVGNYPNQEKDLKITDLEEQFSIFASMLSKIREDIKIIICPGNHDGVRLMEPQPFLDEKFAWPLYNLKNVLIVPNPAVINIGAKNDFHGFEVLIYHGFSFPHYANEIPSLLSTRAMNCPEKIMNYLLMNRHLAPTHGSTQYFPGDDDALLIKNIPDIFLAGHTHKSGVSYYNNILTVSSSCWEAMTPYQEKFGNTPDHCKVPMLNLKTRAIKILDFEENES